MDFRFLNRLVSFTKLIVFVFEALKFVLNFYQKKGKDVTLWNISII